MKPEDGLDNDRIYDKVDIGDIFFSKKDGPAPTMSTQTPIYDFVEDETVYEGFDSPLGVQWKQKKKFKNWFNYSFKIELLFEKWFCLSFINNLTMKSFF